ncbi:MAG: hypothetical protein QOH72_3719 [Solirubrobacteraceae bacterium]|nr:hypothetical protein [Solirubrobacteraceae bacterium]
MHFRSPPPSNAHRSAVLRGFAGAALCASAIATVLVLAPVVGRWVGGSDHPAVSRIAGMPDESGLGLLGVDAGKTRRPHRAHAKPAPRHRHAVLTAGDVVMLAGGEAATQSSPAAPVPAPATGKRPLRPKTPKSPAKKVTGGSPAIVLPPAPAAAANAAASTGLVRLSVQSVGIAPNAAGEPELQAKLGIDGANAADALPPTVTLHLRPQIPATPSSDTALALKAQVDMVDAPRTAPTDPALRLRVRMTIAAAPTGTPIVQEPGPADGKSNVIALTVALTSFTKVEDTPPTDPTTPPDQQGPGDPTTTPPPDQQGPGDPTTTPPPDPQGPGDPTTTPPVQTPTDPTTPPVQTPTDPTTPPVQTPTDPTTPPAADTPAPIPPTEILIPVGPVRPNSGTTTVPVTPTTGDTATAADPVPVEVIVEELPPDVPAPPAGGDVATPGVQDPAPEVAAPPAQPDPGPTPVPDTATTGGSVAVVATDVAAPVAGS